MEAGNRKNPLSKVADNMMYQSKKQKNCGVPFVF